jgi:hypothetical protein
MADADARLQVRGGFYHAAVSGPPLVEVGRVADVELVAVMRS